MSIPAATNTQIDDVNTHDTDLMFWMHAGSTYTGGSNSTTLRPNVNANRAAGVSSIFASTSNFVEITGIQVEIGDSATPFEYEDIGTTLAKCQRYYFHTYKLGVAIGTSGTSNGAAYCRPSSSGAVTWHPNFVVVYPTPMRATPALTFYSIGGTVDRISHVSSGFSHGTNDSVSAVYQMGERGIHGITISASSNIMGGHVLANAEL